MRAKNLVSGDETKVGLACETKATRQTLLSADVKIRLWQTSRDERAQAAPALCANFVLQATNAQGLGTRLG